MPDFPPSLRAIRQDDTNGEDLEGEYEEDPLGSNPDIDLGLNPDSDLYTVTTSSSLY